MCGGHSPPPQGACLFLAIAIRAAWKHLPTPSLLAGSELGWDVFRLQYEVRGPLATLFTASATSQYQRVFQLLWRLKRAECDLSQSWKVLKCEVERTAAKFNNGEGDRPSGEALSGLPSRVLSQAVLSHCIFCTFLCHAMLLTSFPNQSSSPTASRGGADFALEVARKFLRLRSEMSHFCTNLQSYIMFEVLETSWQVWTSSIDLAGNLAKWGRCGNALLTQLVSCLHDLFMM